MEIVIINWPALLCSIIKLFFTLSTILLSYFFLIYLKAKELDSCHCRFVLFLFRFRFYYILKFWENFTVKCFYGLKAIHQNSEADLGAWTAICFFWLRSRQMVQVGLCTLLTLDKSAIFTVISKDSRCVQSKFLY